MAFHWFEDYEPEGTGEQAEIVMELVDGKLKEVMRNGHAKERK